MANARKTIQTIGLMLILASWSLGFLASASADEVSDAGNGAQTRAELCRNACERDYAICTDEGSAADTTLNGRTASDIRGYRCGKDLTACMTGCKGL